MPYIHWEEVDKLRDAVAVTRAIAAQDQDGLGELLRPYVDAVSRAALALYSFSDDYEMALATKQDVPDHQERLDAFGAALGEMTGVIKALSVLAWLLAHHLAADRDLRTDEVLAWYVNWLAGFNPNQFPIDIDDVEGPA